MDIHHKKVQELMGHTSINITLDIYTHTTNNISHAAIYKLYSAINANKIKHKHIIFIIT